MKKITTDFFSDVIQFNLCTIDSYFLPRLIMSLKYKDNQTQIVRLPVNVTKSLLTSITTLNLVQLIHNC